ncbi:MAG: glycosyltransferase family protein [Actinomycetota bacterium]|nr:glycosyltransferase family protein [Actinomycetota bacterium]
MIAFGCSIGEVEPYERYAKPGLELAAEPDSLVLPYASVGTLGRSYNLLLDAAAARDNLEALVIVHPLTEIVDRRFGEKVRGALADPEVAVLGCAGATGVRSIAWWDGEVSSAPVVHRYGEHGGGEVPAYSWTARKPAPVEVETVDGRLLMVLSAWATRNVRFDEGLFLEHGHDLDYCMRVRSAGRRVMTADLRVTAHRSINIASEPELWVEGHLALARKWQGRIGEADGAAIDWKARARRAEAEREAERAMAYSRRLALDARIQALERKLDQAERTTSWRLTEPLRRVNLWRRRRQERRAEESASSS